MYSLRGRDGNRVAIEGGEPCEPAARRRHRTVQVCEGLVHLGCFGEYVTYEEGDEMMRGDRFWDWT